jgi:hypothetical protein
MKGSREGRAAHAAAILTSSLALSDKSRLLKDFRNNTRRERLSRPLKERTDRAAIQAFREAGMLYAANNAQQRVDVVGSTLVTPPKSRFRWEGERKMVSKLLPIGLMVCGLGLSLQVARASDSGCAPAAPATAWQAPMTANPSPNYAAPAPPAGRMAQSNNQTYQSFSAEPAPTYTPAPAATYYAPSYPSYNGGFYGYSPYNYGGGYNSGYSDWRRWDNANYHGISPNYP